MTLFSRRRLDTGISFRFCEDGLECTASEDEEVSMEDLAFEAREACGEWTAGVHASVDSLCRRSREDVRMHVGWMFRGFGMERVLSLFVSVGLILCATRDASNGYAASSRGESISVAPGD